MRVVSIKMQKKKGIRKVWPILITQVNGWILKQSGECPPNWHFCEKNENKKN